MIVQLLDPKMDFIFKKIFGNEQEKSVLLSFLNLALKPVQAIVDVELRNVEITKESLENKNSRLDIKAVTDTGTIINVEIQLINKFNMGKRTMYYWSKLYSEQLKEGEDYKMLNKIVCINILNFNYFKETENYHSIFKVKETISNMVLDDDFEVHFLELTKLKVFDKNDPLSGWGMFLKQPASDMVEEAEETVVEIKKAKEELYKISSNEDERELYRIREKAYLDELSAIAEAQARGREKGLEEGRKEQSLQIAMSLIGLLPDRIIAEKTGLKVEEIQRLKK
ncbi:MAG: Rpn family recombination-promoting nuclease/putative transposase [Fusobacteriaceae bacterium]